MKTSSSGEPSSSTKSNLSKNLKKTSKSRSKTTKSNSSGQFASAQNATTSESSGGQANSNGRLSLEIKSNNDAKNSSEISKEKVHRSYAGFGPKTVKTICEQHEGLDMDILSEVYSPLAEDLTYKVWELINSVKTYARHSGGKVTCDLFNEVLKFSNVPPVVGACEMDWDRIEYDGSFYYNPDEIVELRDEYLKEINHSSSFSPDISSLWAIDRKFSKNLFEFFSNLVAATFLGDEEAFALSLDAAAFTPQIGCVLKLIYKKCIAMLAFEQKPEAIERCLHLLRAITFNPHTRDVDTREQMFHLAELLACLLLDTLDSIKPVKVEPKEESFEMVKNFLENSDQEVRKEVPFSQMDVDDIRSEYEALFQMMERDGLQDREPAGSNIATANEIEKTSAIREDLELSIKEAGIEPPNEVSQPEIQNLPVNSVPQRMKAEYPQTNGGADIEIPMSELPLTRNVETKEEPPPMPEQPEPVEVEYSPYKTEMCDMKQVDLLCSTLGHMGAKFGYFQNECTFLVAKRLEKFFASRNLNDKKDKEYLSRAVRGLVALGEYAFREIIPFLEKADPNIIPEWMYNDFSPAALYLRGRDDIFLYEWLEDLCGDKLCPFMLHFHEYLQKRVTKLYKKMQKPKFVISPKIVLKTVERKQNLKPAGITQMFAGTLQTPKTKKPIGFRFSGCRPVILKPKSKNPRQCVMQKPLANFNKKVVIGRRRLLKSLTDKKKIVNLSNFCYLLI